MTFFPLPRIDNCRERRTGWTQRRFTVERSLWCTSNFAKWTTVLGFLAAGSCKRYQKYCNAGKVSDEPTGPKILGKQPRTYLCLSTVHPVSTWPGWKLLESVISKVTRVSPLTSFPALTRNIGLFFQKLVRVLDIRWRFGWIISGRLNVRKICNRFEIGENRFASNRMLIWKKEKKKERKFEFISHYKNYPFLILLRKFLSKE